MPHIRADQILAASILIVDDQPANVSLLERLLAISGYTAVSSTSNPHDVCDLHRAHGYCLILLDLQMPTMDGFQVMDGLREIEGNDYLPVIVIAARPEHKLRALAAGARDFISMPFDLAEVLMRVRNVIEVRLLHTKMRTANLELETTVREVAASREVIRAHSNEVRHLYDQVVTEQKLSERLGLNVLPDVIKIRIEDEIRPLVPGFLASRRRDVETLRAALAGRDFATIRTLGHAIMETGRGYGFDGMTEIGSAIERAAYHEDGDTARTRITHLSEYLQRVQVID